MKTKPTTRTGQQLVLQTRHQYDNQRDELAKVIRLVLYDPLEITPDIQKRAEQPELENYWIARLPDGNTTRNRVGPNRGKKAEAMKKTIRKATMPYEGEKSEKEKEWTKKSSASLSEAKLN